jgi:predicted metal-dependent HD superfamily phosphohydrolase
MHPPLYYIYISVEYDVYASQIRQEYIHYADAHFKQGRVRVLEKFIGIPSLYRTEECKSKFEDRAKANLRRELATLSQ